MRTRLTVGPLIIAVVVGVFFADHYLLPDSRVLVPILLGIMALVGWHEFAAMTGIVRPTADADRASDAASDSRPTDRLLFVLGALAVAAFQLIAWFLPDRFELAALGALLAFTFLAFLRVVLRKDYLAHYLSALESVAGVLLLGLLFSYHIVIYGQAERPLLVALVYFIGIKGTDIAAYLVGSTIGRHRFLAVSPKKTVEGCLGGMAWGALWFGGAGWYFSLLLPWPVAVTSGIILTVTAQIGDLSESLFKRRYDIKDSGVLLPEFGGVLDLIDSLVFSGCAFWYISRLAEWYRDAV